MAKRNPKASKASAGRLLAREIGAEARLRDAYVRELVDARRHLVDEGAMAREDFDFAQVLAFGACMCTGVLDYHIDRNLAKPSDVKAKVRDCLRISSYELLFLRKPAHAVVDQGVELVRSVAPRAAGLANAVLRKMARDAESFPWDESAADEAALARSLGLPEWLVARVCADCGREQGIEALRACLDPAPTYLVDNVFAPGERFASDLAAQQVASLMPLAGSVLEVGAGRGTKTLLMQCRSLRERGSCASIHTVDLHEYRRDLLQRRMESLGVENVVAHAADARDLSGIEGLPAGFDAVLVDAPCSGTGTLRRHPEIRWRLAPDDVDSLSELQLALLAEAATRVGEGGVLVYATCSILRQENASVVERFLASDAGARFTIDPVRADELLDAVDASFIDGRGLFASLPRPDGPDGHFAARFKRI